MTNLKCIILFYMNVNPRIFIIINSIYLFIYLFKGYSFLSKYVYYTQLKVHRHKLKFSQY